MGIKNRDLYVLVIMFFFIFVSHASAELPVEKFQTLKSDSTIKMWVHAVGVGFTWANATLLFEKKKPLFCPPAKLSLEADNHINILVRQLDDLSKVPNFLGHSQTEIEPILLFGLQTTFPCP